MKRNFKRLAALAVTGAMLMAGFSQQASVFAASKTSKTATDGQVLRIALDQDIETVDPQQNTAMYTTTVCEGTTEGLLREHLGEILPGLAESYETEDFQTWTFTIRDDAMWDDGTPITAHDIEYSYKEIFSRPECAKVYILFEGCKNYETINKAITDGVAGDDLRKIADTLGVTATDDHTLVVELENPRPYYTEVMASSAWAPIKKDLYEANGKAYGSSMDKIASNGPFVMKEWKYNELVVLEKNANYWDKDNIELDRVEIYIVKDAEPRVNMYKEGKIDITRASSEYYSAMKDDLFLVEGSGWNYILANQNRVDADGKLVNEKISELLKNRNFINAINNAIDRSALYGRVMENPAYLATNYIVPENINSNNAERDTVSALRGSYAPEFSVSKDTKKAKEYLAKAMSELGYKNASQIPQISLVCAATPDPKTVCEFVQLCLEQELGIKVVVEPVEFNVRDTKIISGDYDLLYMGWGVSYNDPVGYLDIWADNLFATGWPEANEEEYDYYCSLITTVRTTSDLEEKAKTLVEAEQFILEKGPVITMCNTSEIALEKQNVKGFNLRAFNTLFDYSYVTVK